MSIEFHQKKIYALKDVIDNTGIVLIRQGEMGVCTAYLPTDGEDVVDPIDSVFAIVMHDYSAANPRWYTFKPFESYDWDDLFSLESTQDGN